MLHKSHPRQIKILLLVVLISVALSPFETYFIRQSGMYAVVFLSVASMLKEISIRSRRFVVLQAYES